MESRAKFLGHSAHQMLVPVPAGLLIVASALEVATLFTDAAWIPTVSFWNLAIGLATGVLAAVFGILDWAKIPSGTRAKRVGTSHAISNAVAMSLFAAALWLRLGLPSASSGVIVTIELVAFAVLGVGAWLGGELVDRLGVGVDDGAHLDAPNSLREKHAGTPTRHGA